MIPLDRVILLSWFVGLIEKDCAPRYDSLRTYSDLLSSLEDSMHSNHGVTAAVEVVEGFTHP